MLPNRFKFKTDCTGHSNVYTAEVYIDFVLVGWLDENGEITMIHYTLADAKTYIEDGRWQIVEVIENIYEL